MLEYRKAVVLRDRYGENWLARLGSDSRIRAQFRQIGAQTGRFSSANPNLQQLPRGDLLRKAFIAGPGRKMITADYSQIEIRILAELSQDENMIKMFVDGYDIHAATAQQMFQLPTLPDKDSQHRQMAKSVNFGLIYGAGPENIRAQIAEQGVQVSKGEAEHLIKLYFQAFPKAQRWLDKQSRRAYEYIDEGLDVITHTMGGRVRTFEVSPRLAPFERGHIARQSRNTPIQGSSADITKEAMVRLDAEFLAKPEWDAHILMTVHDEIVVECLEAAADEVRETVERCMIDGAKRWMKLCPVKVDSAIADHWTK
jgi:DNA polymerase I-like protein with 3'-5' exonuclease and polymerase domains